MVRRAKAAARERLNTIEFEYRRRYSLPVSDPRFLDVDVEEMLTDVMAHRYFEDPKLLEVVEDEDFDPDDVERQIAEMSGQAKADDWEDL